MKSFGSSRGFTLIEVVVAFAVVMVVTAAMTSGMVATTRFVTLNNQHAGAVRHAQEVMESLRRRDFSDIEGGSQESEDGRYTIEWTVEEDPTLAAGGSSEAGMKLITVTVGWQWYGQEKAYEIASVYANVSGSATGDESEDEG